MATITKTQVAHRPAASPAAVLIRTMILALTIGTAVIHASLGGLLFLANAAGYATLALGMVLPGPFATQRWLIRLALAGFTAGTIGAWVLFGGRFPLAYVDKGLEVILIGLIGIELWQVDGGPRGIIGRLRGLATAARRRLTLGVVR